MHGAASRLGSSIRALLGPTNTGKTHTCVAHMLEHKSGMIGLPLRLLAREVYDRVCSQIGPEHVALVTGEERRIPKHPRYWVSTVEAMPVSVEVEFLAVDEVQLMTHAIRGHVFTERVLHARGTEETWFLGSASVRPLLEQLVPTARFTSQPRFSELKFVGGANLGKLPPRSVIVAFSASEVYKLAERVRARRGGTAVVLGALSPRTRNAQVAMYQAGEVDYLVATDAIGMGLNMSIDHVALAGLSKFDGQASRPLSIAELAQVAGRAGRYLSNGTFGTLEPYPQLPLSVAERIETHQIPIERRAWWRNIDLDFSSIESLNNSLNIKPSQPCLKLVVGAEDSVAFGLASLRPKMKQIANSPEKVRLLWEVCQIPDYRKLLPEVHTELVVSIYEELLNNGGTLNDDWLTARIDRLNDTTGDIDTLLGRISFVRTWTYVVNHGNWVNHSRKLRERTSALEDALSDALHERLLQRFVERRRRVFVPPVATNGGAARGPELARPVQRGSIQHPSVVPYAAHPFSGLQSLRDALLKRSLDAASETPSESDVEFSLSTQGVLSRSGIALARLIAGRDLLHPEVRCLQPDLDSQQRAHLEKSVRDFLHAQINSAFGSDWLTATQQLNLSPELRGIEYQLHAALGSVAREKVAPLLETLSTSDRQTLSRNVYLGAAFLFQRRLLRPHAIRLRITLSCAFYGEALLPTQLESRCVSLPRTRDYSAPACLAIGYPCVGPRLVRVDILERVLDLLKAHNPASRDARSALTRRVSAVLGCRQNEVIAVLAACEALRAAPRSDSAHIGAVPDRSLGPIP